MKVSINDRLCLITGDDLFEKEKEVNKIKTNFGELIKGINFVTLDKDTMYLLESEVTTFPFGYNQK